jgi:hypothetical protein
MNHQHDWISPARFRLATTGVDGGEIDHGVFWGSRHDQRVTLRMKTDGQVGVLYAYNPLWDEYRILARDITRRDAAAAVAEVAEILGTWGMSVGVLADTVQYRINRTTAQPVVVEPSHGLEVAR